jgi:hypothetical protein
MNSKFERLLATLRAFIYFYKNDLLCVLLLAKLEQLQLNWFLKFSG